LIEEQGGICAYCMQRISNDRDEKLAKYKTEIEHYRSQDSFPHLSLDFKNMLGVCNGNQGYPAKLMHCDKSKDTDKNKKYLPLSVDPLKNHSISLIMYRKDGEIYSNDSTIDQELTIVLNLNQQTLKNNRKQAIDAAYEEIDRRHKKGENWKISIVEKVRKEWDSKKNNLLNPYAQAVIYHLDKIISKLQKQK
jgi:uncharacterized protein (TIGR02646 family)